MQIITGEPNELVATVHTRMPVILPEEHHTKWLGEQEDGDLKELLKPFPAKRMKMWPSSARVNSPENNDEEIIKAHRSASPQNRCLRSRCRTAAGVNGHNSRPIAQLRGSPRPKCASPFMPPTHPFLLLGSSLLVPIRERLFSLGVFGDTLPQWALAYTTIMRSENGSGL
jgi:SOS response associated peptidase (SRAP)